MFYYKYMPLWKSFFTELGAEIIVSDQTNKRILDDGVKACVDEACLPVKLFFGHVINLMSRVDYILIPRFTSISKMEYICPEFGGLPDMVRHSLKDVPVLIDTEINMRKSDRGELKAAVGMGAILGFTRRASITAYKNAMRELSKDSKEKKEPSLPNNTPIPMIQSSSTTMNIAVLGHPYTVYDSFISMDLLGKLQKAGVYVKTIESVDEEDINIHASQLAKPMFWNYGRKAYGAALNLAESGDIEGIICITSFGCGIDSFVNDLIERRIRKEFNIPFITLTIDEHSGEAGFNTRLEAFVDMLQWRKMNEYNISASG